MRLVSALLFVTLTGSMTLADEAKPADPKPEVTKRKVPLRVVRMLPETRQVLLFDRNRGTHVLAEAGQTVDGYVVDEIDEDEVTLISETGAEVILAAPDATWRRKAERKAAKPTKKEPEPVDPYADADAAAPVDPYAEGEVRSVTAPQTPGPQTAEGLKAGEGGVRVVSAPIVDAGPPELSSDPYGDPGIAAFAEAVGATPAPAKTAKTATPAKSKPAVTADAGAALAAAATGSPAPAATPHPAATPAPDTTGAIMVSRTEVNAALGDFSRLAGSFRAAFTPEGLRFDTINDGTILTKIGLRKGDVITTVDGQPLKSLDDAANLYARAGTARTTTVVVLRAGKPVTLRVAIQ